MTRPALRSILASVAVLALLTAPLTACGRKGPPKPPSASETTDEKPAPASAS